MFSQNKRNVDRGNNKFLDNHDDGEQRHSFRGNKCEPDKNIKDKGEFERRKCRPRFANLPIKSSNGKRDESVLTTLARSLRSNCDKTFVSRKNRRADSGETLDRDGKDIPHPEGGGGLAVSRLVRKFSSRSQ